MSQEELEKARNSAKDFRIWVVDKINTLTEEVATLKSDARWTKWLVIVLLIILAAHLGIENLPLPF